MLPDYILLLSENQRRLYRLFETENPSHEIMASQGHTEQKLDAGHGLVAGADAGTTFHQMLLEILHIIRRRCLW